ncbi:MAG: four helix bundle protein [Cytophagales bacterium]|nr:four helix bundle protein [Cytophagales bacterium]
MFKFKELTVFKKAFALAMEIFEISKTFPQEEKYGLTSQIRNSSRSVCSCIGEGYRKRQYPAHFVSKMSDADMENSETHVWTLFAFHCKYISEKTKNDWFEKEHEIGKMLNHMINYPEKYTRKKNN